MNNNGEKPVLDGIANEKAHCTQLKMIKFDEY